MDPRKAKTQNFRVAVSFGATRECGFERDDSNKNMITFPIGDGEIYCFADDTNMLWRHGVIGGKGVTTESGGRISIIAWGWINFLKTARSGERANT